MKNLLEIAKSLREGFEKAEVRLTNEDKDRINDEILNLTGSDFDSFFDELFQDCENISSSFYKIVSNLQFYVGFRSKSETVVSRLWIHAYQKLDSNETKENFLNEILNDDTRYFWNFIRSLPEFCSKIELSASFAAGWLITQHFFCKFYFALKQNHRSPRPYSNTFYPFPILHSAPSEPH